MGVHVESFYHADTGTGTYLICDPHSKQAAIVDAVLDFDPASGNVGAALANKQLAYLRQHNLVLRYILETHAHADHLSAAGYLKQQTGAPIVIGAGIKEVQKKFAHTFNRQYSEQTQKTFDQLVSNGDCLLLGESKIHIMATPGHTGDSVSYLVADNVFVGDTLFMPDAGTARCDFPGGDANILWESIQRLHALPDATKIWVCHDYPPKGREVKLQTTVAESKHTNIHVNTNQSQADYVKVRQKRDKGLAAPRLIYPSLQVNLWGANLPDAESNGVRYIKIPLTQEIIKDVNHV